VWNLRTDQYKKIEGIERRIRNMNLSIKHRGPDAQKVKIIDENVAFGHTRLSIIDLNETADQPMTSNSGRFTIAFNGEIVNYVEIRDKLKYNFKTNSDTEVILASVEENGIDWFLENANGMFALGIYDNVKKELFLVRDRFGIKPLFYTIVDEKLIFASEIKAILASGLVKAEFYEDAIDEYLGNRYVREPYTFFKGIYQLESSFYIKIQSDLSHEKVRYWDLPSLNFDSKYNEEKIIDKTEERLIYTIKQWLISDVPVGSYLSGGVDSSLITAIMALNSKKPIHTYTIGFNEDGYNEFNYSRMVANQYSTIHREIKLTYGDYVDEWERLIWYKDAPLAVPNEIPLAIMTSTLKKDIKVVMSGEGADELYAGYGKIFRLPFDYNYHKTYSSFYEEFINKYEYVSRNLRDKYLTTSKSLRDFFDKQISLDFDNHLNEENVFRFFHNYHIKGLLQRVDMATMQASIEARPPFLDYELIEYSYIKVPYDLKLKWLSEDSKINARELTSLEYSEVFDVPKYILKKISYKYLPKEVIERKKMGFPVPLKTWINNLDRLAIKYLKNAPWFNFKAFNQLLEDAKSSERTGQVLWMFINVEMFRKRYFEKEWRY